MTPTYLDYNATTPVDSRVSAKMISLLETNRSHVLDPALGWGNPSSTHVYGSAAKNLVERAREDIRSLIGADSTSEIIFTSGGSESINHAIIGVCLRARSKSLRLVSPPVIKPNHIIASAIEHVAVSKTIDYLVENFDFKKTIIPVDKYGCVDPSDVLSATTDQTVLITIMLANNEVGTIQPIQSIVKMLRKNDYAALVHTDASQAVGKIPVDVNSLGVDLLSFAGHKMYAPKGVGCLYIRESIRDRVDPFIHGAGHEDGRRAGTENVLLSVALGEASLLARNHLVEEMEFLYSLKEKLNFDISESCDSIGVEYKINGQNNGDGLPNTLSMSFKGFIGSDIIHLIAKDVSCSSGAACHGISSMSFVLKAMGVSEEFGAGTLRLSVGRFTTVDEVHRASKAIIKALVLLKKESFVASCVLPETVQRFLTDTYLFESTASVLQVGGGEGEYDSSIVVDASIFYPQGGGQPSDIGEIVCQSSKARFLVQHVVSIENVIHHFGTFLSSTFVAGSPVLLKVNEIKRMQFARLHSAGHLLDQAMINAGWGHLKATKGYHFPTGPSVEYQGIIPAEERPSLVVQLEEHLDILIQQSIHTRVVYVSASESFDCCIQGQAPVGLPDDQKIRIVFVGGSKGCPCGGTHVKNSKEIGRVKVRKIACKKGVTKISYEIDLMYK